MLRECTNSPKSIASSFLISNSPNICMYTYDRVMKSYIEYCTFFKNIKSGTCEKYKLTTRSRTDYKKFNLYTYSRNFTRSVERLRLLVSLVKINWKPSWNKPIYSHNSSTPFLFTLSKRISILESNFGYNVVAADTRSEFGEQFM